MMLKFLLLMILLFVACGFAAILLRRLLSISERVSDLQNEIKKNDLRLEAQMKNLEDDRKLRRLLEPETDEEK